MKKWIWLLTALSCALAASTASAQAPSGSTPFQKLLTVGASGIADYKNTGTTVLTLTQVAYVQGSLSGGSYTPSSFIYILSETNGLRTGDAVLFADPSGVVNSDSTAPFKFVLQPGDDIELSPIGGSNYVAQATLEGYTTPKTTSVDWMGDIELMAGSTTTTVAGSYTNTSAHSQLITDVCFVNLTNSTEAVPFTYVRCYTQSPVSGSPGTFTTTGSFAEPAIATYSIGTAFRAQKQNFILAPGQRLLLTAIRQGSNGALSVRLTLSGTIF
ncbi:MAG TPA: hypothetical protein VGL56_17735 [Fimbriimonadaceae bacterium]|jgi:hypothetical protein